MIVCGNTLTFHWIKIWTKQLIVTCTKCSVKTETITELSNATAWFLSFWQSYLYGKRHKFCDFTCDMLKVSLNNTKTEQLYWVSFNKRSELNRDSSLQLSLVIDGDSPHCICRDLTEIASCFELVLLQTVDLFRGEQIGSMVKIVAKLCRYFIKKLK